MTVEHGPLSGVLCKSLVIGAVLATPGGMLVGTAGSAAATDTVTFSTAGEHAFTAPVGVTTLHVVAIGGQGGDESRGDGGHGGSGALVSADLAVAPGEMLYAEVGANGESFFTCGPCGGVPGGGGGLASDLRTSPASVGLSPDPRLLVAGAGGGGGGTDQGPYGAGNGGNAGEAGSPESGADGGATDAGGGQPGSSTGGGAGGAAGSGIPGSGGGVGQPGASGGLGFGGAGGFSDSFTSGGQGGSGLYGGGGGGGSALEPRGAAGGGGGGGSSLVPPGGSETIDASGEPEVAVSFADTTAPVVSLTEPAGGSTSNNPRPTFAGAGGTVLGDSPTVTVNLYAGRLATGIPVETFTPVVDPNTGQYVEHSGHAISDGEYTAESIQTDGAGNVGRSATVSFAIKTDPPMVDLWQPSAGTVTASTRLSFAGTGETRPGDSNTATVRVFAGGSTSGHPLENLPAAIHTDEMDEFFARSGTLAGGRYTVDATQSDGAGDVGISPPVSITIVSRSQIRKSLANQISPHGAARRVAVLLLFNGQMMNFRALTAGRLRIRWYLVPRGAGHHAGRAIASGGLTFGKPRSGKLMINLSREGRVLLAHGTNLRVVANGVFVPVGAASVSTSKVFSLVGTATG